MKNHKDCIMIMCTMNQRCSYKNCAANQTLKENTNKIRQVIQNKKHMSIQQIDILWEKIENHMNLRYELTEDDLVEMQNALIDLRWKL